MSAYANLLAVVRDGGDPRWPPTGTTSSPTCRHIRKPRSAFHDAMAAGARLQAVMLAAGSSSMMRTPCSTSAAGPVRWSRTCSQCIRNSGEGWSIFPKPRRARATFSRKRASPSAPPLHAGDFFAAVPGGYDRHVLTTIVHDWGDDDCSVSSETARRPSSPAGGSVSSRPHCGRVVGVRSCKRPTC